MVSAVTAAPATSDTKSEPGEIDEVDDLVQRIHVFRVADREVATPSGETVQFRDGMSTLLQWHYSAVYIRFSEVDRNAVVCCDDVHSVLDLGSVCVDLVPDNRITDALPQTVA